MKTAWTLPESPTEEPHKTSTAHACACRSFWWVGTAFLLAALPVAAQWQCTGPDSNSTYICQLTGSYYTTLAAGQRNDSHSISALLALDSTSGTWHMQNSSGDLIFYSGGTLGSITGTERLRFLRGGSVGIGTPTPASLLHVYDTAAASPGGQNILTLSSDYVGSMVGSGGRVVFKYYAGPQETADIRGYTFGPAATGLAFGTGFGAVVTRMVIDNSGNVGIGTTSPAQKLDVNGSLNVGGNATFGGTVTGGKIVAQYQDLAEWVPTDDELAPGTVVVVKPNARNQVIPSVLAYDTSVAGVVSEEPGITLGEPSKGKAQIATTGRVKVKVDATEAPIHAGDILVTSKTPGTAMKSEPVVVAGIKMHRPGTIIGKALEPLDHGRGEILVLLSLQ